MFGLFKKDNGEELALELPFKVEMEGEDIFGINIEAVGEINNEVKYFYACYDCKNEEMLNEIYGALTSKSVNAKVHVNPNKIQKFKIDLDALAEEYGNENIKKLSLIAWGANDTSSINN